MNMDGLSKKMKKSIMEIGIVKYIGPAVPQLRRAGPGGNEPSSEGGTQ